MRSAHEYIDEVDMSRRPEFYSGRGPKPGDLGYRQLSKLLGLVKKDGGDKVAEAFVAMVAGLKSAAATTFLLDFYKLERQDWKWFGDGADRDFDIGYSTYDQSQIYGNAFATIGAALDRDNRNESADDRACRGRFLTENGWTLGKKGWRKLRPGEDPPDDVYMDKHGNYRSY